MKISVLRALVGEAKFDSAMAEAKADARLRPDLSNMSFMRAEPDNSGMSIEEGREALARAVDRKIDLPPISKLTD